MYFIPCAIFYGHPTITTSFYVWKSLIPTTLGNIVGGGLFVAVPYWYLYLWGEDVPIESEAQAFPPGTRIIDGQVPQQSHSGTGFEGGISHELSAKKFGNHAPISDIEKDGSQHERRDSEATKT